MTRQGYNEARRAYPLWEKEVRPPAPSGSKLKLGQVGVTSSRPPKTNIALGGCGGAYFLFPRGCRTTSTTDTSASNTTRTTETRTTSTTMTTTTTMASTMAVGDGWCSESLEPRMAALDDADRLCWHQASRGLTTARTVRTGSRTGSRPVVKHVRTVRPI